MGFKKFSLHIILRTIFAIASLVLLSYLLSSPGFHASSLALILLIGFQLWELIRFVSKTNAELIRFLDAARYADYSQSFDLSKLGAGFDELGRAFEEILQRMQQARTDKESLLKHLKSVVEHIPVPLLSIHPDHNITLWNSAARKLFGTYHVTKVEDLTVFSEELGESLLQLRPGDRKISYLKIDDMSYTLSLTATHILIDQNKEILVSLHDIHNELDVAQLNAWQDLVSVLTHEIMNSITPVASLADTTVHLVNDVQTQVKAAKNKDDHLVEALSDIESAVTTVARRSEGLIHFVKNYRRFTKLPAPKKTVVKVEELLQRVLDVAAQHWAEKGIDCEVANLHQSLDVICDQALIEQVLINLLKNAEQAISGVSNPKIMIDVAINQRGHLVISVSDNGVGIDRDILSQIFIPFFTTKSEGSGVGLALSRQIMTAHKGSINVAANEPCGTKVSLVF